MANVFLGARARSIPRSRVLKFFSDSKISIKIAIGFGVVLTLTLALSVAASWSLNRIEAKFVDVGHKVLISSIVRDIDRDFLAMRRLVRDYGHTGEIRFHEEAGKRRQVVANEIAGALKEIRNPERHGKMTDAAQRFTAYAELFEKMAGLRRALNETIVNVLDPTGLRVQKEIEQLQALAAARDGNGNAPILAGEAMKQLMLARLGANKTLARHDKKSASDAERAFQELSAALTALSAKAASDDMRKQASEVSAFTQKYRDSFKSAARDAEEIDHIINGSALQAAMTLGSDLEAIKKTAADEAKAVESAAQSLISSSQSLFLVFAGAGLMAGAIFAWLIGRAIAGPIKEMTDAMGSLASGRLDIKAPTRDARDEIGEMAEALQVFKDAAIAKTRRDAEIEEERRRNLEAQRRAEEEAIRRERELVTASIGAGLAKLSAKDLSYRMTDDVPEAYRRLQADFNAAIEQLEGALEVVAESAEAIGAGASQISVASDDLSKRTEHQAASLEETAAALEEITVTVKKSAEGAAHASAIVGTTRSEAGKSGEIVRQAVGAMGRIEKSSQEISQIIGVIDEIAFQTNLLALNAGVEAARAGDAGKGFAVVASEVRALAQRSAEAAKEIKGLISQSSSQVGQGVELVGQTGEALEKIVAQVMEIDRVVAEIANGAREQATSLAEVNVAITHMDQTTQQNAAMVEETTAATHNLRSESNDLLNSVQSFNLSQRSLSRRGVAVHDQSAKSGMRVAIRNTGKRGGGSAVRKPMADSELDSWAEF
jgi:methyl-accepting chemotaxis protein